MFIKKEYFQKWFKPIVKYLTQQSYSNLKSSGPLNRDGIISEALIPLVFTWKIEITK